MFNVFISKLVTLLVNHFILQDLFSVYENKSDPHEDPWNESNLNPSRVVS